MTLSQALIQIVFISPSGVTTAEKEWTVYSRATLRVLQPSHIALCSYFGRARCWHVRWQEWRTIGAREDPADFRSVSST